MKIEIIKLNKVPVFVPIEGKYAKWGQARVSVSSEDGMFTFSFRYNILQKNNNIQVFPAQYNFKNADGGYVNVPHFYANPVSNAYIVKLIKDKIKLDKEKKSKKVQ